MIEERAQSGGSAIFIKSREAVEQRVPPAGVFVRGASHVDT